MESSTANAVPPETMGTLLVESGSTAAPVRRIGLRTAAGLALISSVLTVFTSIARSKVTAQVLGVEGIGEFAEINQLFSLVTIPIGFVSGAAFVTALAKDLGRRDQAGVQRTYDAGMTIVCALSVIGALVATVASHWALPRPWGPGALPLVALAGATLVVTFPTTMCQQLLIAHQKMRASTALSVIQTLVALALVCGMVVVWKLPGQFMAGLLAPALVLPLVFRRTKAELPSVSLWPRPSIDWSFVKVAASLGAASIIGSWTLQGALTAIRYSLDEHGGLAWNGQFQAANAVATTYFNVVATSLGSVVWPRYAACVTNAEIDKEFDDAYRFVLRTLPPIILSAIVFRKFAIQALYSHKFDGAIAVLGVQMVADILKGACWVQGGLLFARVKTGAFILLEGTSCALVGVLGVFLIPRLGLVGVAYAFLIANTYNFVLSAILVHYVLRVKTPVVHMLATVGYTVLAAAILVLTTLRPWTSWFVGAAVGAWAVQRAYRGGLLARPLRVGAALLRRLREPGAA